jgi:hypothetical protein
MATTLGQPVEQPPTDGITRLRWTQGGSLLATSWDQVRAAGRCTVVRGDPTSVPGFGARAHTRSHTPAALGTCIARADSAAVRWRWRVAGHLHAASAAAGRLLAGRLHVLRGSAGWRHHTVRVLCERVLCCRGWPSSFAVLWDLTPAKRALAHDSRRTRAVSHATHNCVCPVRCRPLLLPAIAAAGHRRRVDLSTQQQELVGRHADGVKCTEWVDSKGERARVPQQPCAALSNGRSLPRAHTCCMLLPAMMLPSPPHRPLTHRPACHSQLGWQVVLLGPARAASLWAAGVCHAARQRLQPDGNQHPHHCSDVSAAARHLQPQQVCVCLRALVGACEGRGMKRHGSASSDSTASRCRALLQLPHTLACLGAVVLRQAGRAGAGP